MAKVASKVINDNGVEIKFGEAESPVEVLAMGLEELSEDMVKQLALHGLSQKVGDSYSGVGGNVEEAVSLATGVWERLKAGEFRASRESSGGAGRVSDLARALAEVAGVDLSAAVEKLAEMTKEEKKGLKDNIHIAKALNAIAEEKLRLKQEKLEAEAQEADPSELANMFA